MMIKGGIRIGGLGISGYDADAVAYFERAGVTDGTAKGQINAFVKGIKDLGLYNSMACWPLRSSQNAGTGTTAYSLGGLGIYNGTLVNGPSWTTDGIDHTASSFQTTTFPISLVDYGATGFSLYFAGKPKTGTQAFSMIFGQEGVTVSNLCGMIRLGSATSDVQLNVNYTGGAVARSISSNTVNSFNSFGATVSPSSVGLVVNSSTSFTTPSGTYNAAAELNDVLKTASRSSIGTNVGKQFADLISSFGLFTTSTLDASQHASLISLYKTTLGTGLGLP
jgi:hypothetical protein